MKKNKGFAISSVIYAMLILFLGLILLILSNLASRKAAFDKEKNEILARFNEDKEIICTAKSIVTNGNLAYGEYNYGDEYSCELGDNDIKTFYVLEENDSTVSLIMNKNIDGEGKGITSGNTIGWCSDETLCKTSGAWDNTKGSITANIYLKESTKNWTKLKQNQISLPTGPQVATAGRDSEWTIDNYTKKELLYWLYENLNVDGSAPNGYWTSTLNTSGKVWYVHHNGTLENGVGYDVSSLGIRPVITIQKSQINNLNPILCVAKSKVTNGNLALGNYNYGDEYNCELGDGDTKTFYVLKNNGNTVSLIMNMNINSEGKGASNNGGVMWCKSGDENSCDGDGAKEYLSLNTKSWIKLNSSQISLPSVEQIATAAGKTFDEDEKINNLPTWLHENLNKPYSYHTLSANKKHSNQSYGIYYDGSIGGQYVDQTNSNYYGVRPVITIQKSQIKNLTILCTAKTIKTNGNLAYGEYNYGDEYSCNLGDNEVKTFYVLEENSDDTVSLIMNMNIDSNGKGTTSSGGVTWCKTGSNNSCAADQALEYLTLRTTRWRELNENQISLPTYNQIYKAAGDTASNLPTWIYGNLNSTNPNGYWTSTSNSSNKAWTVNYNNNLSTEIVTNTSVGIRPVIKVPKSQIKNLTPTILCTAKTNKTNGNLALGNYNYGDEYSCDLGDGDEKTFYVIGTSGKKVSLIMDRNLYMNGRGTADSGSGVKWCSNSSSNTCEADGAISYLEGIANQYWTKIDKSQVSLPTTSQIDEVKSALGNVPTWIYGNLNSTDPNGYWTSVAYTNYINMAWKVNNNGGFSYENVETSTGIGVRPVITISKINIQN